MSHTSDSHTIREPSPESRAKGYEVSDWSMRPVLILTIACVSLLPLAIVVIFIMLGATKGQLGDVSHNLAPPELAQLPPSPRLEQNPNIDGARIVREATEQIESYGWVNQRTGVAHIPIDRAKELLLEQGIAPFAATQPEGGTRP